MENTRIYQNLDRRYQERLKLSDSLCCKLSYSFKDFDLLAEALTHSSAAQEILRRSKGEIAIPWNERLEFLGDSVLGLVLSTHLLHEPENFAEGQLSKIRAALVNESSLAGLAKDLDLGECLLMSSGENKGGGRVKASVLADALEALLGAIYLDGGFAAAEDVILRLYKVKLSSPLKALIQTDYKSRLQELTQSRFKEAPQYNVVQKVGPEHKSSFQVDVDFRGNKLGSGFGPSKKAASQDAARNALSIVLANPTVLTEGMS